MAFPKVFPAQQLEQLLLTFLPGRTLSLRQTVEAAFDVLGYALHQVLPAEGEPVEFPARAVHTDLELSDEEKVQKLKEVIAIGKAEGTEVRAGVAIPWYVILFIAKEILEKVLPLLKSKE
jgi:hypothetical protein